MYNKITKDHFLNPRNVGEIKNPNAVGVAVNKTDGDKVQLHFRFENNQIADAKMKVMGCVAAIAATSILTEMVIGMSRSEALLITREMLAQALGGLPEQKMQCSLTCLDALKQALKT